MSGFQVTVHEQVLIEQVNVIELNVDVVMDNALEKVTKALTALMPCFTDSAWCEFANRKHSLI